MRSTWTSVIEGASEQGCACTLTHECFCAPEGLEAIRGAISENDLNGILVAACSDRAKTSEFNALTVDGPSMFRVALREHCAWPLKDAEDDEDKTAAAPRTWCRWVSPASTVSRLSSLCGRDQRNRDGGGQRSRRPRSRAAAAGLGHPVVLVEKDDKLGGLLANQKSIPPEEPPYERRSPTRCQG